MARKIATVRASLDAANAAIVTAYERAPQGDAHAQAAYQWHTDALAKLADAVAKLTAEVEYLDQKEARR